MKSINGLVHLLILSSLAPFGVAQQQKTIEAFDQYVTKAEARITQSRGKAGSFLAIDELAPTQRAQTMASLRSGEVVIEKNGEAPLQIPDGLIHDWAGTVFIPRATVVQVLSLIQDYDHSSRYYSPDVIQSRLVSHQGDDFHVFMRLKKHKVVTVVLDTEYDVHYARLDAAHRYSNSRSTRIREIADPGTPTEHALSAGNDHGFMWRLNSYWAFEQIGDGVIVECEAISLTRDIPSGLGWMIGPFVNSIPRESLQFTLHATRTALADRLTGSMTP